MEWDQVRKFEIPNRNNNFQSILVVQDFLVLKISYLLMMTEIDHKGDIRP